jgi:hydrogenase small subunit
VGVPCFGCTASSFPKDKHLFLTQKLGDIPAELPLGVNRANYLAYKGLAKSATPQRLKEREIDV